jgi:hypothetical protein
MSTARIEVLIVAPGAGGIAVHPASGGDNKHAKVEIVARPRRVPGARSQTWPPASASNTLIRCSDRARHAGAPSLALRSSADLNAVEDISDDQAAERSASVNVVGHGIAIQTTAQK